MLVTECLSVSEKLNSKTLEPSHVVKALEVTVQCTRPCVAPPALINKPAVWQGLGFPDLAQECQGTAASTQSRQKERSLAKKSLRLDERAKLEVVFFPSLAFWSIGSCADSTAGVVAVAQGKTIEQLQAEQDEMLARARDNYLRSMAINNALAGGAAAPAPAVGVHAEGHAGHERVAAEDDTDFS